MLKLSFLAHGSESIVYVNGDGEVIKVPRRVTWRSWFRNSPAPLQADLDLLQEFGVMCLATEVLPGPITYSVNGVTKQSAPFVVRQPRVQMRALLESDLHNAKLRQQVVRMMHASCKMSLDHGRAVDFVGLDAGKRFVIAAINSSPLDLAMDNLHVTEQGDVVLIDVGLMSTSPLATEWFMMRLQEELVWLVVSPFLTAEELASPNVQFLLQQRGAWHKRAAIKLLARATYYWSRRLVPK